MYTNTIMVRGMGKLLQYKYVRMYVCQSSEA